MLNAPEFIKKHYATEISAGTLNQAVVRREDPKLYEAFYSWRRSHRDTPLGFEFPRARQPRDAKFVELYGEEEGPKLLASERELIRRRVQLTRARPKDR